MATAAVNELEIWYETFGDPSDEPLLLVMGLGAQAVLWDEDFCHGLVERGFHVIRFDNRDVGLSSKIESDVDPMVAIMGLFGGQSVEPPYVIADMAADAAGLLDALGIDSAHIVGASMGGMITQQLAIDHPHKVRSITSIMSTTGDPDVGAPDPEALGALMGVMANPPTDREGAIAASIETNKVIAGPHFDEERARRMAERTYDRMAYPEGMMRQLLAVMSSPPRSEGLREVTVPALVIHGTVDPLVTVSGGRRTAESLADVEYIELDDMGHDSPPVHWPVAWEAIARVAQRAAAKAEAEA